MNYILLIVVGAVFANFATLHLNLLAEKNSQKREMQMNKENFVVKETSLILVAGVLFIIVGSAILLGAIYLISGPTFFGDTNNNRMTLDIFVYFIAIGAAVIGLGVCMLGTYFICIYYRKRLVVAGEELTYYPAWGKSKHYTIYDITKVGEQQVSPGQIAIIAYQGKKKIFSFDNTCPGYGLLRNKLQQSGYII
jgi:hypothetical protein